MIEYKLIDKEKKSPITLDNFENISNIVTNIFLGTFMEKKNMGRSIRETYGVNGSAFHIYYRNKDSIAFIPRKYEEIIKEFLESTNKLELEKIKCQ